jgi:hypothetical protein
MSRIDPQLAESAQAAYLNLLRRKGAATGLINQRKHFLRHLVSAVAMQAEPCLTDCDAGYRRAVDTLLGKFPDEQQLEIIVTAREFYPFWIGDLKTIARLNAADALATAPARVDVCGSLADMFARMDADPWSTQLPVSLARYLETLKRQGASDAVIDIRERLLMLLLYVIREAEPVPANYRAGVDAMLTLFSKEESRRLFIEVAREFFYHWSGCQSEPHTVGHAA